MLSINYVIINTTFLLIGTREFLAGSDCFACSNLPGHVFFCAPFLLRYHVVLLTGLMEAKTVEDVCELLEDRRKALSLKLLTVSEVSTC